MFYLYFECSICRKKSETVDAEKILGETDAADMNFSALCDKAAAAVGYGYSPIGYVCQEHSIFKKPNAPKD